MREFELGLKEALGITDFWDLCCTYFTSRGVFRAYCLHLPPLGAPDADSTRVFNFGYENSLMEEYVAKAFFRIDWHLQYAKSHPAPFFWSEVPRFSIKSDKDRELADFYQKVKPGAGLGVPVFGPNGRNGYCSLELPSGVTTLKKSEISELQWASQVLHLRLCTLLLPQLGPTPKLSPREREILVWVARGKSNLTIAEILGISAHTVDAHLRRIFLKLGVFDRITAAVRGIGTGLIHSEN